MGDRDVVIVACYEGQLCQWREVFSCVDTARSALRYNPGSFPGVNRVSVNGVVILQSGPRIREWSYGYELLTISKKYKGRQRHAASTRSEARGRAEVRRGSVRPDTGRPPQAGHRSQAT